MRLSSLWLILALFVGCGPQGGSPPGAESGVGPFGAGKADGPARELDADVPADASFASPDETHYFVFSADAGTVVDVEVTRAGTARGLDTLLRVLGPRTEGGTFDQELAADDEAGYGQLSRIEELELLAEGDYVIEVGLDPSAEVDLSSPKQYRLLLTTSEGSVEPPLTGDLPKQVHWVRNSAEYIASVRQAYRAATLEIERLAESGALPAAWGVVMDVDETILSNSQYRRERELGLETTWWQWVSRREATALPGADAFMDRVRALGGVVALVTNRHVSMCGYTEGNLRNVGIEYDAILCQDGERDKDSRWQLVERGEAAEGVGPVELVMWIGDNIHDFRGLDQEDRFEQTSFAPFGTRYIVVPNPMSGSWVSNPQD